MNQKNDIAFSSNLNLYLQQNAQADTLGEIVAELRLVIKAYRKMFLELWESDRRDAMLKAFSLIDGFIEELIKDVAVTCKKGCSFCCHMDIDITSTEAQLIKEYMAVNAIGIDAGYLEAQLSLSKVDRPLSQTHSACVFLKGENCLIYPVRPIACRKHLMNSAAVFCDQKLMVGSGVGKTQVLSPDIEALHSAIEDALKEESGRMAGILLRELDIV